MIKEELNLKIIEAEDKIEKILRTLEEETGLQVNDYIIERYCDNAFMTSFSLKLG